MQSKVSNFLEVIPKKPTTSQITRCPVQKIVNITINDKYSMFYFDTQYLQQVSPIAHAVPRSGSM